MVTAHEIWKDICKEQRPTPDTYSIYEFAKLWMNAKGEIDADCGEDDSIATVGCTYFRLNKATIRLTSK